MIREILKRRPNTFARDQPLIDAIFSLFHGNGLFNGNAPAHPYRSSLSVNADDILFLCVWLPGWQRREKNGRGKGD